jgi:hypothetical protein
MMVKWLTGLFKYSTGGLMCKDEGPHNLRGVCRLIVFLCLLFGAWGVSPAVEEEKLGGIIFFRTGQLEALRSFYVESVGCTVWMDQKDCVIFQFGNMLFGFCTRENVNLAGMVTFFYDSREKVDEMYGRLESRAAGPPKLNTKYAIYHFFAKDPEGRDIEFQYFLEPIHWPL